MDIRDRLSRLTRLRGSIRRVESREVRYTTLKELLPGEEVTNEAGSFYLTCSFFPGSFRHGCYVLRDAFPLDTYLLSTLAGDPNFGQCNVREGIFLDTETTGLSGGTGTLPFLIGLGWFEENGFVIHQLFIRDYDEEKSALIHLNDLLQRKKFLVTFNGKAFDVNLLNSRFILNRLPPLEEEVPHLDLLYPARRLLGHRLRDRSLLALEHAILGLEREGDIYSHQIPYIYFEWLKRRDVRPMVRVFEHNRLDILSLVTLTARLVDLINPEFLPLEPDGFDRIAAGRLWAARGSLQEAISLLESIRCKHAKVEVWQLASRELSLLFRRHGLWKEAVSIWEEMVAFNPQDTFALIELAKYYEHKARRPEIALNYALRAKGADPRSYEVNHRIERLKRLIKSRRSGS